MCMFYLKECSTLKSSQSSTGKPLEALKLLDLKSRIQFEKVISEGKACAYKSLDCRPDRGKEKRPFNVSEETWSVGR